MSARVSVAASGALLAAALLFAPAVGAPPPERAGISPAEARAWKPDMRAARKYATRRAGDIDFAVVDMAGRAHLHRAHETAYSASLAKVMLMAAYLRRGSVKRRALDTGERRLLRRMIRESDNSAATTVHSRLGASPIQRLARRARMKDFEWSSNWGLWRTSPRDQARFMRKLHRYVPGRHWPFAKRQLALIVPRQRWGIGAVKPPGWKLHFKGGWAMSLGGLNHQVAFLRHRSRRVGLAVFTTGNPSRAYGTKTLAGVFRRLLRGLPR